MKKICTLLLLLLCFASFAQKSKKVINIYNPEADAKADIDAAMIKASKENKHVLVQVGGNWCPWCIKLHEFYTNDPLLDSLINADYVLVKVNYSPENENFDILKRLEYPQRFGYPVLVVLNARGRRIHTQNTGYFEYKKAYDKNKIVSFLEHWKPSALNPDNYAKR